MLSFLLTGLLIAGIPQLSTETPNRQPQLATSGNRVAMVFGSGKSIMFAQSSDRGDTFGKPVRVADLPVLALGRHRGPRVAFGPNSIVVTAIGGSAVATGPHAHGLPSDGNLLAWRSTDGGKTWSAAVTVNDAPTSAREGLHSLTADREGHLAAVWLDLRGKGTLLYGSVSNDGGATWSKNAKIYESPDGTICQCCHPTVIAKGKGEFAVMFRNVLGGNRDMYVTTLNTSGVSGKAVRMGEGNWAINACPMDGGGLAVVNGRLVSAWRRSSEVYLAPEGKAETRVGEGKDIALAGASDKLYAVWVNGGIRASEAGKVVTLSEEGAFPSVVGLEDGSALAAWEQSGAIAVHHLAAK